jgi:hypothetical protein
MGLSALAEFSNCWFANSWHVESGSDLFGSSGLLNYAGRLQANLDKVAGKKRKF